MQFTEAEDAKFWPVYREYETELAKINDDRMALIKEYALGYDDADRRDGRSSRAARARPRGPTARAHGELLRALQVGAPAEDGGAVPPGRASDPAAPRSADRRVAAHRVEVTAMRTPCLVFSTARGRRRPRQRVAVRRSRAAPVRPGGGRIVHERRRQDRPPAARQRPDRRVPGRRTSPRWSSRRARRRRRRAPDPARTPPPVTRADGHGAQRPPHGGDRRRRRAGRHDVQVAARRSGDDRRHRWSSRAARPSCCRRRRSNRPAR